MFNEEDTNADENDEQEEYINDENEDLDDEEDDFTFDGLEKVG